VVSGLEPENTNSFLIALAECASDPSYDNAAAVRMCLSGVLPGASPPPLKVVYITCLLRSDITVS